MPLGTPAYAALTDGDQRGVRRRCRCCRPARAAAGRRPALQSALGAPLVFLGVGLPDDQIHAPNEKVNLSMLYRGAEAAALLWPKFAAAGSEALRTVAAGTSMERTVGLG